MMRVPSFLLFLAGEIREVSRFLSDRGESNPTGTSYIRRAPFCSGANVKDTQEDMQCKSRSRVPRAGSAFFRALV